jgi:hypothetical protein
MQGLWCYAYFGYARSSGTFIFVRTFDGRTYEQHLPALHRVPKYLALYKAKDGFHTPYNGKMAYFYLMLGKGAYREKDMD